MACRPNLTSVTTTTSPMTKLYLILLCVTILSSIATAEKIPNEKDDFYCSHINQIHLSVGHDASSSVTVSFVSASTCLPHYSMKDRNTDPVGVVSIGTSPTKLSDWVLVIEASHKEDNRWRSQYNASNVHGKSKDHSLYVSDPYHHVTIYGLESDTTYYYRCFAVSPDLAQSLIEEEEIEQEEEEVEEDSRRTLLRRRLHDRTLLESKFDATTTPSFTTAPPPGPIFHTKKK
uniref:Purple acid phosphatase N-terminal domain-containing protein n=1 Tax=Ditylum brightwellii TaxID=49249 RepID=A0A7S4QHF4_9STRA